ncbi:hypothetical protein CgunFtcFv8_026110 [Champsocephalus gunnari]|uniref:Uncharacterized protein n=1 Tax=Champsocephalus gunnari TaxID=52237 RepID=A0AAN8CF03_CHAGU|nr:hypothetical protein CgunFtcFv8_026110 [Champsocephalus gunnari]
MWLIYEVSPVGLGPSNQIPQPPALWRLTKSSAAPSADKRVQAAAHSDVCPPIHRGNNQGTKAGHNVIIFRGSNPKDHLKQMVSAA